MEKFLKKFERVIVIVLLGMMALVVLLGTIELAVIILDQMLQPPRFILLGMSELLAIFNFFLLVLIGLELIEVIKVYLVDEQVHVEVIFLVAIIAVARKVIVLDVKELDPLVSLGMAAIIVSLAGGYYLLKRGLNLKETGDSSKKSEDRSQNREAPMKRPEYRRQKPDFRRKRSGDRELKGENREPRPGDKKQNY
jgi:uncharacterized membrane protein (DUF373 family)